MTERPHGSVEVVSSFETAYAFRLLDWIDRSHSSRVFEYREVLLAEGDMAEAEQPGSRLIGFGTQSEPTRLTVRATEVEAQQELHEGPIVAVTPAQSSPWIGVFTGGGYGVPPARRAAVITFPDPDSFCVVKGGLGCLIDANQPENPHHVDSFPIRDFCVVAEHELVLFADFTDLVAYGRHGKVWESGRLAWDDLKIVSVEGTSVSLTGFNAPTDEVEYPFNVDLLTGRSTDNPYNW